jgi:hypothetical protein
MVTYPGLSQGITISVIGTVAYGIWSSRSSARTNQALAVARALSPRIIAQNDAAWLVLQEGATDRLTKILLEIFTSKNTGAFPMSCDAMTRQVALSLVDEWGLVERKPGQLVPSFEAILQRLEKLAYLSK